MMTAEEIIVMMEEALSSYECQDNVVAAQVAKILRRQIARAKGNVIEPDPRPQADFSTLDLDVLREKYLQK